MRRQATGKIFTKVICDKGLLYQYTKKNPLKTQQYDNEQPVLKISSPKLLECYIFRFVHETIFLSHMPHKVVYPYII